MKKLLVIVSCLVFSNSVLANRCSGIILDFPVPNTIDISKYNVGDVIHTISLNSVVGSGGVCYRENNNYNLYFGVPNPPNSSSTPSWFWGDYLIGSDISNNVSLIQKGTFKSAILLGSNTQTTTTGNVNVSILQNPFDMILKNKVKGKAIIDFSNLINPSLFYSWYDWGHSSFMKEPVTINLKPITLVNRVSCNITTDDSIDFGNILASTINGGVGPSKIVNVGINCDGVPLKYTMTFSSAINVPTTNPIAGILGSTTHNNMGYQLTWGDSQIGGTDNHLSLDVDYPSKAAKQNQTVPIKLKPVSLRYESAKPGRVDASLRITIRID